MSESMQLLSSARDVERVLEEAAAWCDELDLCASVVDSQLGRWPLWQALLGRPSRIGRAYVAVAGLRSEPHALEELHRLGVLRFVPAADHSFRSNVLRFSKMGRQRIVFGSAAWAPPGLMAPLDSTTCWEGDAFAPLAVQVGRLFERAAALAHVPEPDELADYAERYHAASEHHEALEELGAAFIRRTAYDGELMDLEVLTDSRAVSRSMHDLSEQLASIATQSTEQLIGFRGGAARELVHWSSPLAVWSVCTRVSNRYWNAFGVDRPVEGSPLAITVEVNPPFAGVDRKMGGAVAVESSTGKRFLVHRGRIGGGRQGIGASLFWSRFRGGVSMREPGREEPARVVVVGEIGAPSFPRDLAAFVHEVARIKRAAV